MQSSSDEEDNHSSPDLLSVCTMYVDM